jgi:hypothetical protein
MAVMPVGNGPGVCHQGGVTGREQCPDVAQIAEATAVSELIRRLVAVCGYGDGEQGSTRFTTHSARLSKKRDRFGLIYQASRVGGRKKDRPRHRLICEQVS